MFVRAVFACSAMKTSFSFLFGRTAMFVRTVFACSAMRNEFFTPKNRTPFRAKKNVIRIDSGVSPLL